MALLDFVPRVLPRYLVGKRMGEVRKQQLTKQCKGITTMLAFEQRFATTLFGGEYKTMRSSLS